MVFALDPAEHHYNLIACVHGGILSALCDTAAGLAVHSRLPFGKTCTTLELHVNFIRPVSIESGRATCVARSSIWAAAPRRQRPASPIQRPSLRPYGHDPDGAGYPK